MQLRWQNRVTNVKTSKCQKLEKNDFVIIDPKKSQFFISLTLREMTVNLLTTGHFWTPPASFRVNLTPFQAHWVLQKMPFGGTKDEHFSSFRSLCKSLNFLKNWIFIWIVRTKAGNQNSDQNPWRISQEFCGHLILQELKSHLNDWILRLAIRILIKILEEFQKNSLVMFQISTVGSCNCSKVWLIFLSES